MSVCGLEHSLSNLRLGDVIVQSTLCKEEVTRQDLGDEFYVTHTAVKGKCQLVWATRPHYIPSLDSRLFLQQLEWKTLCSVSRPEFYYLFCIKIGLELSQLQCKSKKLIFPPCSFIPIAIPDCVEKQYKQLFWRDVGQLLAQIDVKLQPRRHFVHRIESASAVVDPLDALHRRIKDTLIQARCARIVNLSWVEMRREINQILDGSPRRQWKAKSDFTDAEKCAFRDVLEMIQEGERLKIIDIDTSSCIKVAVSTPQAVVREFSGSTEDELILEKMKALLIEFKIFFPNPPVVNYSNSSIFNSCPLMRDPVRKLRSVPSEPSVLLEEIHTMLDNKIGQILFHQRDNYSYNQELYRLCRELKSSLTLDPSALKELRDSFKRIDIRENLESAVRLLDYKIFDLEACHFCYNSPEHREKKYLENEIRGLKMETRVGVLLKDELDRILDLYALLSSQNRPEQGNFPRERPLNTTVRHILKA